MSGRYDVPGDSWKDEDEKQNLVIQEREMIWERFVMKLDQDKSIFLDEEEIGMLADQAALEVDVFFKMIEKRYSNKEKQE